MIKLYDSSILYHKCSYVIIHKCQWILLLDDYYIYLNRPWLYALLDVFILCLHCRFLISFKVTRQESLTVERIKECSVHYRYIYYKIYILEFENDM